MGNFPICRLLPSRSLARFAWMNRCFQSNDSEASRKLKAIDVGDISAVYSILSWLRSSFLSFASHASFSQSRVRDVR